MRWVLNPGLGLVLSCALRCLQIILAQTLSDGYMGTEENIFAIAFARFPHLFAGYDNNQWGIHGDNWCVGRGLRPQGLWGRQCAWCMGGRSRHGPAMQSPHCLVFLLPSFVQCDFQPPKPSQE
jgi:hypothetical protein